ncbi:MAG: PHP-associated domain-containing protein [Candidatus Micrarchaeota archaeon]|nr:PHP-associated domain-containing protein [Candidatus Micrarchaeota archaeon]
MKIDFRLSSLPKKSDKSVNLKIDFHCHTNHSPDSIIVPRELAAKAKKLGIIPAITDHNSIAVHKELRKLKMQFIPSEEIRTNKGDLIGLYLNEIIPKYTPFLEAIDSIKEQGGISYLPHMYDKTRHGVGITELAKKVDIIEIFNARCPFQKYNDMAMEFANKNKKIFGVGGDNHFLFEFGNNWVDVPNFDLNNPKELVKALKSKQAKMHTRKAPIFVRGSTLVVKFAKKFFQGLTP